MLRLFLLLALWPALAMADPPQRPAEVLPRARWEAHPDGQAWTRATLQALRGHGKALLSVVPEDIADWCPAYPDAGPDQRAAFWNGLLSALAKHESTWRPNAVGGGGKWFGLVQIAPATAQGYGCQAQSGAALKNGADNLSCAVRIMAITVLRDGAVALKDGRAAGLGADWGPFTQKDKRADMAGYLKHQIYCRPLSAVRPKQRPLLVR